MLSVVVLLAVVSWPLVLVGGVAFDPNVDDKVTQQPVTGFSSKDDRGFEGKVFIMAVHEQHPFVFFDCAAEPAREEWDKDHPADPKAVAPVPELPVAPPANCKRQQECPKAPDSEPFCGVTIEVARQICG